MSFAKLFNIKDYQVLITISYNPKSKKWDVDIRSDSEEEQAMMTLSYNSKEKSKEYVDKFLEKQAVAFHDEMFGDE